MKNVFVGNLPDDTTKQDICEFFGLNSTSYLRDTCNIDFRINNKTGKFKGFTFLKAPEHIWKILRMNLSDFMAWHTMITS